MSDLPQAILFDLDDTILEFHALAAPAWAATLESVAADLHPSTPAQVQQRIDAVSTAWWSDPDRHRQGRLDLGNTRRMTVSESLESLDIHDAALVGRIVDEFERRRFEGLRLFPGALDTLDHFQAAGVPMALLTNGDSAGQRAKIERFELAPYFSCIIIEGEFGAGKPDPRVFQHALAELNVEARHTWMVGDRAEWEILPAQQLGIWAIWVDVHGKGMQPDLDIKPDRVIHRISELVG
ncbi:MAG: HAD family hydrolase [Gemmatimonadetes bacterium]|jgi:putative hydrolase of the HAD superfamily|nr:HAD family hydrolase [Gemmatimonadota bacterium]MBT7859844.1 HAD family hydrolase [Gemmatimonadota bacterium]